MKQVRITHRGHTRVVAFEESQSAMDAMVAEFGAWVPGESRADIITDETVKAPVSDWGKTIIDDDAKARIEKQHDALKAAGVNVDPSQQFFATGTRMADIGYASQAARASEHASKQDIGQAIAQLTDRIRAEVRADVEMSAGDLGRGLSINGALTFNGLKLREQAIRGLLARMESTALRHVLGLRDRIGARTMQDGKAVWTHSEEHRKQDREQLLDIMQRECRRFESTPLKLRTRKGLADVFAVVSPEYGVADAPEVLAQIADQMPEGAKGSFSYDPTSTSWELRASVWTPTPSDQQAVGEAFEGYTSLSSKDNGTGRLNGGGGAIFLRCLNASTYQAGDVLVSRVHRSKIMVNLPAMMEKANDAIHALCKAWGIARESTVSREVDGVLIPIEQVIPGFYRHMLTARKGELVGVLPGRTESHVLKLTEAFHGERRDGGKIVRADLANGFTKYIQGQDTETRRGAESAIASWLVKGEKVAYVAA